MRIAICDDDPTQIKYLSSLVKQWAVINKRHYSLDTYDSAEAFHFTWCEDKRTDVLLLDIQMPGCNGMALAKLIRQIDEKIEIIFITGFTDYMDEGYEVSALHYLIKPVKENKLFACLDKASEKMKTEVKTLLVESNDEQFRIRQDEILYLEAFAHTVVIATVKKNIEVRSGIGELAKKLDPDSFISPHRSYHVGLKFVQRISKTELFLDNGMQIPVSRRLYPSVNSAFINFYKDGR